MQVGEIDGGVPHPVLRVGGERGIRREVPDGEFAQVGNEGVPPQLGQPGQQNGKFGHAAQGVRPSARTRQGSRHGPYPGQIGPGARREHRFQTHEFDTGAVRVPVADGCFGGEEVGQGEVEGVGRQGGTRLVRLPVHRNLHKISHESMQADHDCPDPTP